MALIDAFFDRKSIHEKPVLFFGQLLQFIRIPRPFEPAVAEKLIKKQESVSFPEEALDSVRAAAAEQEERPLVIRIQMKLCLHKRCQTHDPIPEVCPATSDVHLFESTACRVIEHG